MISFLLLATALQPPDSGAITVRGRDYLGVEQQAQVISGSCDGIPSSARIVKTRKDVSGAIELRHGGRSRAIPSTFADGLLVHNAAYAAALGCDGKRLLFVAHVVQMKGGTGMRYFTQRATWDFQADSLVVSDPVDETAAEFAAHVR